MKPRNACWLLLAIVLSGCGTAVDTSLYGDPLVPRQEIDLDRVAIVPNRLPLNLTDPEHWRRHNWEIISEEFTDRGIAVVDYPTSVRLFAESALPIEDTPAARDKYAALAESMGVDAIVVPYYGTMGYASGFPLLWQTFHFVSVSTLQVYAPDQNVFVARLDASGDNRYTTLSTLTLIPSILASGSPDAAVLIGGAGLVLLLHDLFQGLRSPRGRWERAFRKSLREGLEPFFVQYR